MALQGQVVVNGEWVTRSVPAYELFKQTRPQGNQKPIVKPRPKLPPQPNYGVLTKTVVDSPVIRWVLSAQLRSSQQNYIILVGDHYVQICEFSHDRLQNVARKQDFGSRICNACVIGHPKHHRGNAEKGFGILYQASEDEDDEMDEDSQEDVIPPQLLALVLEHGTLVFLHLTEASTGELEFVWSQTGIPGPRLRMPGYHMDVDPSSRYLALACSQNLFIVYELRTMRELRARNSKGQKLSPVKACRARSVAGVIHKLQFLFPNPDNQSHVVLMLIIHSPLARMAVYDWEHGDSLEETFREQKDGHRLEPRWNLPLLIVPLTLNTGILLVTEHDVGCCYNLVDQPPDITALNISDFQGLEAGPNSTTGPYCLGSRKPVWTAWSRSSRFAAWHRSNDVFYLVREDGIVKLIEATPGYGIDTTTPMGSIDCRVDTAFGCVPHAPGDVLIAGGDAGLGALYFVRPRERMDRLGNIANWSRTLDIVTTSLKPTQRRRLPQADRVIACSGGGRGAVAEFRHGLEAVIKLESDIGVAIRQCWAVPVWSPTLATRNDDIRETCVLLALPNSSLLVKVSTSESMAQEAVPYDLSSSTLAIEESEGRVVQVTANSITVVTPHQCLRRYPRDFDAGSNAEIAHCALRGNMVGLAFQDGSHFGVRSLALDGLGITAGAAFDVEGEVTCIGLGKLAGATALFVGVWTANGPGLSIYPTGDVSSAGAPFTMGLSKEHDDEAQDSPATGNLSFMEAVTSILVVDERPSETVLIAGSGNGDVLTIIVNPSSLADTRVSRDTFGLSPTNVFPLSLANEPLSILVCSEAGLVVCKEFSGRLQNVFNKKHRVWASNEENRAQPTVPFHSVTRVRETAPGEAGSLTVLMACGTKFYVAALRPEPRPVMRYMDVDGTPVKVVYSQNLDVLAVAVSKGGVPSIHFLDPETGVDLTLPVDANGYYEGYVGGLGKAGTRVTSLCIWKYQKDGREWEYLAMGTTNDIGRGRVLLVQMRKDDTAVAPGGRRRIRAHTEFKRAFQSAPVFSIATDKQGLFICSGNTVYYEIMDNETRKLKPAKRHELPSPAGWMEVVDGHLHVVTSEHSLEILDYKSNPQYDTMDRLYTDMHAKKSLRCIEAGENVGRQDQPSQPGQSVTLVSDVYGSVYGMWAPAPGPSPGDRPLRPIFQAEMTASIRSFTRGHTKPSWELLGHKPAYGSVQSSADGSDILGLAIDGSLHQFTLLNADAWRLLWFLQNLAQASPSICPFQQGTAREVQDAQLTPDPQVKMQVDGDILKRCLEKRALREIMVRPEHVRLFQELLRRLEGGKYTQSMSPLDVDSYIDLGYDILSYYTAPALG